MPGCDLVSKFNVGLKSLLKQGLPEPEFYGDLVYKGPGSISGYFGLRFLVNLKFLKSFILDSFNKGNMS